MTTEHVGDDLFTEAFRTLGGLATAGRKRLKDVRDDLGSNETQLTNVVAGAQLATLRLRDEAGTLREEEDQLAPIFDPRTRPPQTRQTDEPGEPDDRTVSEVPSAHQPAPAPTPDNPGPEPTNQVTRTAETPVVVVERPRFIPWRLTSVWEWILAFVGAFIGFLISRASNHWITHTVFKCPNGVGYYLVATLWVIILIGLGFCLGGLLGWYIDRQINTPSTATIPA